VKPEAGSTGHEVHKTCKTDGRNGIVITLEEVFTAEQFDNYYRENSISTIEEKIKKLRKDMGIIGIRGEEGRKPEDILALLEDSAIEGYWRAK
jgi:non-homologous end joining protein Ku